MIPKDLADELTTMLDGHYRGFFIDGLEASAKLMDEFRKAEIPVPDNWTTIAAIIRNAKESFEK